MARTRAIPKHLTEGDALAWQAASGRPGAACSIWKALPRVGQGWRRYRSGVSGGRRPVVSEGWRHGAVAFVENSKPPSGRYLSLPSERDRNSSPRAGRLKDAGVEPSVGSVGDSYDNALAETINGLYKAEVIWRRGPWRNFERSSLPRCNLVDWFNNKRLLEPIGNIPPAEPEARYYAQMEEPHWRRDSNEMASGKPGAVHGNLCMRWWNGTGERGVRARRPISSA